MSSAAMSRLLARLEGNHPFAGLPSILTSGSMAAPRRGLVVRGRELCTVPELTAFGTTFPTAYEDRAVRMASEVQQHLDRDWNVGDHARPLSSVLSAGRFVAQVHDGWPPLAFPTEHPRYE